MNRPTKSKNIPVTQEMLYGVRNELKHDISSLEAKMNAGFKFIQGDFKKIENRFDGLESRFSGLESKFDGLESRFDGLEGRFDGLEGKFNRLESKFDGLDSKFEKVLAIVARTQTLVEEQNQRNKFVLDGFALLHQRVEKIEQDRL